MREISDIETQAPETGYVGETLRSGIKPLEMRFCQINSAYRRLPIAYRSFTYVNSVIEGVLPPEKYAFAADGTDRGLRLAKWNMQEAMHAIDSMHEAGRNVQFVTARCPASLAMKQDLYEWMKNFLEEERFAHPEKLCLEFPQSLLFEEEEQVRAGILSLKLLKVKTMMSGCGETDCPVANLFGVPVDMVLLAPRLTALTDNRDKGGAVAAFLSFLRSLQMEVIGEGATTDEGIRALSRADCMGYIPSPAYGGTVRHGSLRMTLEDAVAQREEEEM